MSDDIDREEILPLLKQGKRLFQTVSTMSGNPEVYDAYKSLEKLQKQVRNKTGKKFPIPSGTSPRVRNVINSLSAIIGHLEGLVDTSDIEQLKQKNSKLREKVTELEKGAGTYCALIGDKCEIQVETKDRCFVIFDYGLDQKYEKIVEKTFEDTKIEPRIAKKIERPRSESVLCTKVCKEIRSSQLCIADVTQDNINVGLEVGLAWRYGKPVIITMDKNERSKPPSDFHGFEFIFYENYNQLEEDFEDKITKLVGKDSI